MHNFNPEYHIIQNAYKCVCESTDLLSRLEKKYENLTSPNANGMIDFMGMYDIVKKYAALKGYSPHVPTIQMSKDDIETMEGSLGMFGQYPPDEDDEDESLEEYEGRKAKAIDFTNSLPDRMLVYRSISVSSPNDIRLGCSAGESWSLDASSAYNFGGHNASNVMLAGEVDKRDCNLGYVAALFMANSGQYSEDDENEVLIDGGNVKNMHWFKRIPRTSMSWSPLEYYQKGGVMKSGDPATYDNNGNIIPLGMRFDDGKDDLRY